MIKVLYDYSCFVQRIGGVSRYHVELMKNVSPDTKYILQPLLSDNVYLKEIGHPCYSLLGNRSHPLEENIKKQINQWMSIAYLHSKDYDVFHTTGMNPYFIGHTKKPVVITVHDLIHEKYPDIMPKADIVKEKRRKEIERADAIVCISQQTKQDLMDYHNVDERKISVIYHGIDQTILTSDSSPLVEVPYILYVGGRNNYKNFSRFLEAYSRLGKEIHLVCTGKPFNADEQKQIESLGITQRVHQIFATDAQMNNLFCHALCFVYPSMCEGFGMPILEAFRCCCPSVISDILCFHEVAGDAALYFNPTEVDDMTDKIERIISDNQQRETMISKGCERVPLFTWEKCATKTENVYRNLI